MCLALILSVGITVSVTAKNSNNSSRPKAGVALVMSGGGAKGLYHIGVIKALEENDIPIDYVGGTSMGAIVAGFYAAGYSPDQMYELAVSGAIEQWLTGGIDSNYGSFYKQFRDIPSYISFHLDLEKFTQGERLDSLYHGTTFGSERERENMERIARRNSEEQRRGKASFHLPGSLISTTKIDMALSELFTPATVACGGNFDELFVPFLCVASDMVNKQAVVLREGDLGEALRSSMSLPIAFKPVPKDGMLLYDGGIYDNYPWQQMVDKFNPETIIGSVCSAGEDLSINENSDLITQILALTTEKTDYTLPEGHISIGRNVPSSMLDFSNAAQSIAMGYHDTMEQMEEIKETITRRTPQRSVQRWREDFLSYQPDLLFDSYEITGLDDDQQEYIHNQLRTILRNDDDQGMTFGDITDGIYSILAYGEFNTIYPHITYNPESERFKFGMEFSTKPQLQLSVGGNLSSTAFNQIYAGLDYKRLGRISQQIYADLYLGPVYSWGSVGGRSDFYLKRPLFVDYNFSAMSMNLDHGDFGNVTEVTNTESVSYNDSHFSLGAGLPISNRSLVSLRTNLGVSNYNYDPIPFENATSESSQNIFIDKTTLDYLSSKIEYQYNTLDKILFPQHGNNVKFSAIGVWGFERNSQSLITTPDYASNRTHHAWYGARLECQSYVTPPGEHWFSLGFSLDAVHTNIREVGNPTASLLIMPSYQPVIHSKMLFIPDYSARSYIGVGVMPTFNIFGNLLLRTGFYSMCRDAVSIEGLEAEIDSQTHFQYIVETSLIYHTPLGPISLSATKYDVRDWKNMYVTFNFGYAIFAPKGTFY